MDTEVKYSLIKSGFKDYIRLMIGETQIVYIKTTPQNFDFIEQELRYMVEALNVLPVLAGALKSIRGVEAWITPSERHLVRRVYAAIDEYEKTSIYKDAFPADTKI